MLKGSSFQQAAAGRWTQAGPLRFLLGNKRRRVMLVLVIFAVYMVILWFSISAWIAQKHSWGLDEVPVQIGQQAGWRITWVTLTGIPDQPAVGDVIVKADGVYPTTKLAIDQADTLTWLDQNQKLRSLSFSHYVYEDPSPNQIFSLFDGIILSMAFLLAGFVVYLHAPIRSQGWSFLSMFTSFAVTFEAFPAMALFIHWANALTDILGSILAIGFACGFLLQLVTAPPPGIERPRSLRNLLLDNIWLAPVLPGIPVCLWYLNLSLTHTNSWINSTPAIGYEIGGITAILLIAAGTFVYTNKFPSQQYKRDPLRWILAGTIIAALPYFFLSLLPEQITGHSLLPETLSLLALAAVPPSFGYVVLHYKMFKLDSLVRESLILCLQFVMLASLAVGCSALLTYQMGTQSPRVEALIIVTIILISLSTPFLGRFARFIIEAGLFRDVYRYRKMLKRIEDNPKVIVDLENLSTLIIGQIKLVIPSEQVALYILDEKSGQYQVWPRDREYLYRGFEVQKLLLEHLKSTSWASPQTSWPDGLQQPGHEAGNWNLFVSASTGETITAFIALGARSDGQIFSGTDLSMLQRFMARHSIQIDYARLYADLQTAHEEQLKLDHLKDQFLATAAHELRTPLTNVYGYLELMNEIDELAEIPEAKSYLNTALSASKTLVSIVGSLLDTSRLQLDASHFRFESVQLAAQFRNAAETLALEATKGSHDINLAIPEHFEVRADRQYLARVILNLLANAIKYSPLSAGIDISAAQSEDKSTIIVNVRDYGKGIPPEECERVFVKFVRLDRDLNSTIRGAGLGLFFCRQLIEIMGGKIWVESTGVSGEGSAFKFSLPVAESMRDASAA